MIRTYRYQLWAGKKKQYVGAYWSIYRITGTTLVVPELSIFKQPYNRKIMEITVPIMIIQVADDGVEITMRRVLDVRRLSKRQIAVLTKGLK